MVGLALTASLAACTDWDDHYDQGQASGGSGASLWETISTDANLSDFASLLKRTHYDEVLAADQNYTVWAPENSQLDSKMDSLTNLVTDSALTAEFIRNHVARGSYRASGALAGDDAKVYMLNGKIKRFEGNGTYTMDGIKLDSVNIPVGNGVLHKLTSSMAYEPNIYENLFRGENTTGIASFFRKYATKEIDTEKSVEGPMKDGELTYLDTVFVESNDLFDYLDTEMDSEDSTYTMVLPNDEAWGKGVARVAQYCHIPSTYQNYTLSISEGQSVSNDSVNVLRGSLEEVDADSLSDFYTKYLLAGDLIFSHTYDANKKLANGTKGLDSLISTTNTVFKGSDAEELFTNADGTVGEKQVMSNGTAYVVDSLHLKPWISGIPVVWLQATNSYYFKGALNANEPTVVKPGVGELNPEVEGTLLSGSYLNVVPSGNKQANCYFNVPNIMSTRYAVYLTLAPANIVDTSATVKNAAVDVASLLHTAEGEIDVASSTSFFKHLVKSNDKTSGMIQFKFADEEKPRIMTKYVGEFDSKVCYPGVSENAMAGIRVNSSLSNSSKYDITLRIEGLIFVPMEVVKYFQENYNVGDYTGEMPEAFWELVKERYRNTY